MTPFVWPSDVKEARLTQEALKGRLRIIPLEQQPHYIAGVDASFIDDTVIAVTCLYEYPVLNFICHAFSAGKTNFPYIPGYLAMREGPAIIDAIGKLRPAPDVIIFDGHGIAHPYGLGIASHIGVLLSTPTIGCAKSMLVGSFSKPGTKKGRWSALRYNKKTIGAVLRTRDNISPLFISAGHMINLKDSIEIVLGCTGTYRTPLPLRCADMLTKKIKHRMLKFK